MRVALAALTSVFLIHAAAVATPSLPLQHGEQLSYRVSWAVVPGAGEIKIDARADPAAPTERLLVTSTTATRGLARMLLPFNAESESVFDLRTGQLLSLHEENNHRRKANQHTVTFDYRTRLATYFTPGVEPRPLEMPPGDPVDLIMGLLETRSWNLKPGEKRDALILFDDDFYELSIHFARYEDVTTPLGRFKTVVLEPRMDKTAPKGMFKRGSKVRVWIAQGDRRLPVKFEVEFKIGTGTATLESYTPPAVAKPMAGRPAVVTPVAGTPRGAKPMAGRPGAAVPGAGRPATADPLQGGPGAASTADRAPVSDAKNSRP